MEESKVTRKNRVLVTFDVTEKKIKIPKSLRPEIKSYRRIGFGPNERDVLIGEIVNGKYLVFPLQKEIDLENSELYIVERDPRDKSEDENESDSSDTPVSNDTSVKYKVIGYIKIKDVPDNAFFLYDDIIWNVRKTEKRAFITNIETGQRIADYYREKNKDCNNPYSILYKKMVKQVKMITE